MLCGYREFDSRTGSDIYVYRPTPIPGDDEPEERTDALIRTYVAPWNKLLRRRFVLDTGIRFQPIRNTNDHFFSRMILLLAEKIEVVDKPYVNYRFNNQESLQGQISRHQLCYGTALTGFREELIKRDMLHGALVEAYRLDVMITVDYHYSCESSLPGVRNFYEYTKALLDGIFPGADPRLFAGSVAGNIMESADFAEFLWLEMERKKNEREKYVASTEECLRQTEAYARGILRSPSYRIGHAVTAPVRLLQKLTRHQKTDGTK